MCENIFKQNIRKLIFESGLNIQKFAIKCGLSRQTMQNYASGTRMPDSSCLQQICKACSVSADWLLGLSDTRSLSPDIQNAVAALQISEKAVEQWEQLNKKAMSHLLEQKYFPAFISLYGSYINILDAFYRRNDLFLNYGFYGPQILDETITLHPKQVLELYAIRIGDAMKEICLEENLNRSEEYLKTHSSDESIPDWYIDRMKKLKTFSGKTNEEIRQYLIKIFNDEE